MNLSQKVVGSDRCQLLYGWQIGQHRCGCHLHRCRRGEIPTLAMFARLLQPLQNPQPQVAYQKSQRE